MFRSIRVASSTSRICRAYSKPSKVSSNTATQSTAGPVEVKGLSEKCVKPCAKPDGEYKVSEYFAYNRFSFAEAEIEMLKYRCPQPSANN